MRKNGRWGRREEKREESKAKMEVDRRKIKETGESEQVSQVGEMNK